MVVVQKFNEIYIVWNHLCGIWDRGHFAGTRGGKEDSVFDVQAFDLCWYV